MLVMLFGVHPAYSSIVAGARLALHPGGGRAPLPLQFALLVSETDRQTDTRLMAFVRDYPGEPVPER